MKHWSARGKVDDKLRARQRPAPGVVSLNLVRAGVCLTESGRLFANAFGEPNSMRQHGDTSLSPLHREANLTGVQAGDLDELPGMQLRTAHYSDR